MFSRSSLLALLVACAVTSGALAITGSTPPPLQGVPLNGMTGLRLLVASDPPFLFDVDTGGVRRVRGLNVRGNPILSVHTVGEDAIVWLARRVPAAKVPVAEIYVIRHRTAKARRLASGWDVVPAADGRSLWLKSYRDARHCTLRQIGLDGRQRRAPRALSCSTRLVGTGAGAVLVRGQSVIDPRTGRTLLRTGGGGMWAIAGHFALTVSASHRPLALTNLLNGQRQRLSWPSEIDYRDEAAVLRGSSLIAAGFADPAYQGTAAQVTDVWILDTEAVRFQHLPDMPASVSLKFTSISWARDGRLVWLGETGGHDFVAVWRPGEGRIAVRQIRLPARNSGSDSFLAWSR